MISCVVKGAAGSHANEVAGDNVIIIYDMSVQQYPSN